MGFWRDTVNEKAYKGECKYFDPLSILDSAPLQRALALQKCKQ